jgi:hypothetical protein
MYHHSDNRRHVDMHPHSGNCSRHQCRRYWLVGHDTVIRSETWSWRILQNYQYMQHYKEYRRKRIRHGLVHCLDMMMSTIEDAMVWLCL